MRSIYLFLISLQLVFTVNAQSSFIYIKPDRIFDGEKMVFGNGVLIKDNKIIQIAEYKTIESSLPPSSKIIELKGKTILPGFIEGHSHLFLHPYNETTWNDQVLKESRSYRTARAVVHAHNTIMAGFTTVRDLGTEGAEYDDVGLKKAINDGIIPGPRMLVATKALIATGSYGPSGFSPDFDVPQGAEEADGHDDLIKKVRGQIGKGADLIKVYADYRWGKNGEALPTFSLEELKTIVNTAASAGRPVVAHASTAEGMKRAILAGVETIEHGDSGTEETWKLMVEKNVCLCPTLAAGDAVSQYRGWKKGTEPEPERITAKRKSFEQALTAGVKICAGGDVGVFPHGENARELLLMLEYGMKPANILKSATSINADQFGISTTVGRIKIGLLADIIAVEGDPVQNLETITKVKFVMKDGMVVKD